MNIPAGSNVYVVENIKNNLDIIKEVLCTLRKKSFFVLKPSVIPIKQDDILRYVAIPQLSIITPEPLRARSPDYILAEDTWIEAKAILESGIIKVYGNGPLSSMIRNLGIKDDYHDQRKCVIIDEHSGITTQQYLDEFLNTKHVAILSGLENIAKIDLEGELIYYWSTHPLLAGLSYLMSKKLKIRGMAKTDKLRKLQVLAKPLIFIDEYPIMAEITYNNSVVFTGYEASLEELLIRSLIYTC